MPSSLRDIRKVIQWRACKNDNKGDLRKVAQGIALSSHEEILFPHSN